MHRMTQPNPRSTRISSWPRLPALQQSPLPLPLVFVNRNGLRKPRAGTLRSTPAPRQPLPSLETCGQAMLPSGTPGVRFGRGWGKAFGRTSVLRAEGRRVGVLQERLKAQKSSETGATRALVGENLELQSCTSLREDWRNIEAASAQSPDAKQKACFPDSLIHFPFTTRKQR